ncbi:MAG: BlaI/MecI/CopY family transcriptional regulator [Bacteroidota bacterium]|nr:MAG: BlaI/MecI/CopY family transcriptional regulator [Bacteroidota bacterium]
MDILTKLEEEVMLKLWERKQAFVKELIEEFPAPKPHYNTISTILKILVEKKFVDYEVFGKSHRYFPAISKESYLKQKLNPVLKNYFSGSFNNLVSFFLKDKKVKIEELEALLGNYEK